MSRNKYDSKYTLYAFCMLEIVVEQGRLCECSFASSRLNRHKIEAEIHIEGIGYIG